MDSCLQVAQKKNRLGRSLKAAVSADIYQQLSNKTISKD
jgi:predicted RNA-binding protein YlxR (DUF448 family)